MFKYKLNELYLNQLAIIYNIDVVSLNSPIWFCIGKPIDNLMSI